MLITYPSHKQYYPLLVNRKVERDKILKYIRSIRIILSYLSRTIYRTQIKSALKGNWEDRLKTLETIDLRKIDFDNLDKHNNKLDVCKVIAFQIGQCLGLMTNKEYYTKNAIAKHYPLLKKFLYREESDILLLNECLNSFVNVLKTIDINEINKYDLINEKKNG